MNNKEIGDYYDHFDARLLNDYLKDNNRVMMAMKRIFKLFDIVQPKKVLDLGCGIGWSSFEIVRNFPQTKVLGLDLSTNLIKIGKAIFSHPNLKLDEKDLTDQSFIKESGFDSIIMIDVFEHIPKAGYEEFAKQLKAVLNEKFTIFFSCPTINTQDNLKDTNPDALQPVDEDVDQSSLTEFASFLGASLVYYNEIEVWRKADYLHAVISNVDINSSKLDNITTSKKFETRAQKIKRILWSDLRGYLYKQNLTTKVEALGYWLLRAK